MIRPAIAACCLASGGAELRAQAWNYPSFQTPRVVRRELNFAVAGSDGGTTLLFQWREGRSSANQLSLDAGFADRSGRGSTDAVFVGGQFARQLATANADLPLDALFTAGVFAATRRGPDFVRVPVGVSLGRHFPVEGGIAFTPFVHPRLSLDICRQCRDESDISVSFDVGLDVELTRRLTLRASGAVNGSDYGGALAEDAFGVSLAWRPALPGAH